MVPAITQMQPSSTKIPHTSPCGKLFTIKARNTSDEEGHVCNQAKSRQEIQGFWDIQLESKKSNMPGEKTVKICMQGAHPIMKPSLAMAKPMTVDALLKLPIVVDDMTTDVSVQQMLHMLTKKDGQSAADSPCQLKHRSHPNFVTTNT